jgi:3-oxoacyl-[acyl-carrier protein] reductase
MDLGISGKSAFVSAASAGIGRAVASALASEGCRVAICGRRKDVLADAARRIGEDSGVEVVAVPGDLSVASEIAGMIETARGHLGPLDILVNNAGGPRPGRFDEVGIQDWEDAYCLNLRSAVLLCQEVLPDMKRRQWGRIVNLTSISVKQPIDGLVLSNSIRAGVAGLAKTLATECAPFNVLVNTVCPGYTLTERIEELARIRAAESGGSMEQMLETMGKSTPAGRIGTPGEIAALVAFLCSERAAYMTGTVIPVDGGLSKGLL